MTPIRPRAIAALLGLWAIVLGSVGVHRHVTVETHARCTHGDEVHVRRVSDAGPGAYNGVFVPSDGWTTRTLALDDATFASADQRTLSVSVQWSALGGCPTSLRLALHVVHGALANEWKDLVPTTHTPWQMPGGGYYEIDLTASPAVSGWSLR